MDNFQFLSTTKLIVNSELMAAWNFIQKPHSATEASFLYPRQKSNILASSHQRTPIVDAFCLGIVNTSLRLLMSAYAFSYVRQ